MQEAVVHVSQTCGNGHHRMNEAEFKAQIENKSSAAPIPRMSCVHPWWRSARLSAPSSTDTTSRPAAWLRASGSCHTTFSKTRPRSCRSPHPCTGQTERGRCREAPKGVQRVLRVQDMFPPSSQTHGSPCARCLRVTPAVAPLSGTPMIGVICPPISPSPLSTAFLSHHGYPPSALRARRHCCLFLHYLFFSCHGRVLLALRAHSVPLALSSLAYLLWRG